MEHGIRIVWRGDDIDYCTWVHLGVWLRPGVPDPYVLSATWTYDGESVAGIPFPWQTWAEADGGPVDLVWPDPQFALVITRQWATLGELIPLENLTRGYIEEIGVRFEPREPEILEPGDPPLALQIPTTGEDAAALVMYSVAPVGREDPFLWFIGEAELSPEPSPPPEEWTVAIRVTRATGGSRITAGKIGIRAGDPADFAATVTDAEGNPLDEPVTWSVKGTAGTVDETSHLVASTRAGDAGVLIATAGSVSDSIRVTIISNLLKRIEITPSSVELKPGERITFRAQGDDAYENKITVRPFWHVAGDIGTISSITGTFVAKETGVGYVIAFAQAIFGDAKTGVEGTAKIVVRASLPTSYALSHNYPNPFNSMTTIAYDLPKASDVTLTLYTFTGQAVAVLVDAQQEPGHHTVLFNGSGYAAGVYLYRLEAGSFVETKRMVLLK